MKTRSFCAGAVRVILFLAATAILAACAPPLDSRGEGYLRIVLGGEASRGERAISPAIEATLSYKLYFSGPGGEIPPRDLEPGIKNITLTLSLGNWTIRAEAYHGEVLYGSGETTVTVEAGRTNDATIHMKTAAKEIAAFGFASPEATGIVDPDTKTIAVTVPYDTAVTGLVPTIVVSEGASVSPESGEAQDFTEPVAYIVTAANGFTETWTVTVIVAPPRTAKEIAAFNFATPEATGIVDLVAHAVTVTVPYGTAVTGLVPAIAISEGASISPASGEAQDFTEPVAYAITAEDGSAETWTVTVIVAPNSANDITGFRFNDLDPQVAGTVNAVAKTIVVTVPYGAVLTGLVPTITHLGASISPESDTAQDFTNSVAYTVTAANGSTAIWTVTVTKRDSLITIAEVEACLASAAGGTASNPVFLPVTLNLADSGGNGWAELLGAIDTAGKRVALDLSACTMSGMTGTPGEFDPGAANTGESLIVSLTLPTAAESIKAGTAVAAAFQNFTGLASVTGVGIKNIGNYAFLRCAGLLEVNYPAVENIGVGAFAVCAGLTSVNLSAGLTSLGQQAFLDCAVLASITLPASLASIGPNPFAGCIGLTTFIVDGGNPNYKAENGKLLSKDGTTLVGYPTATGTITLSGITTVGPFAFQDCDGLVSVDLPNATSIGDFAFDGCVPNTGSTTLTVILGSTAPMLGSSMFSNVNTPKTITVKVPAGATGYGSSPANTTANTWGNGFRGGGWNGTAMTGGQVNANVNLILEPAALANVAVVATYLATGSAANPVPLAVTLNLAESGGNGWAELLGAIDTAGKHVALGLSACDISISGMIGAPGEFDPGTTSAGKDLIVSLVLPDNATSIKPGVAANNATFRGIGFNSNDGYLLGPININITLEVQYAS
jgi:hypothetical protein